ncbi:NYN domain-containing protein [Candidatus Babeliales bacterium]|nr:NYN domain-containing protein [Candidatus Babeliales bacterium]
MIIVIDGYNLLRHIFPKAKGLLDKQRQQLIKQLGLYKAKKKEGAKEIVVVFDGGTFGHASREVRNGIVIIFSGQKSSADDWIIEYTEKKKGEEILLVSLDRKLIQACEKYQAHSIDVFEFYTIVQDILLDTTSFQNPSPSTSIIQKYEPLEDLEDFSATIDQKSLDALMEAASMDTNPKETGKSSIVTNRKDRSSPSKKLSKQEKNIYHKIKKLH